jgi:hypothetical protein
VNGGSNRFQRLPGKSGITAFNPTGLRPPEAVWWTAVYGRLFVAVASLDQLYPPDNCKTRAMVPISDAPLPRGKCY